MAANDVFSNFTPDAFEEQFEAARERFEDLVSPGVDLVQNFVDAGKTRIDETLEPVVGATTGRVVDGVEAYDDQMTQIRTRSLEALDTVGERYVDFVKTVAEKLPHVEVPLVTKLPSMEARVTDGFEFAAKVLDKQKELTVATVGAFLPLVTGDAPKAAPKPAAKTTKAKAKSSARKAPAKSSARKKAATKKAAATR